MIRLIAIDMDGTLVRNDKSLSPAVVEAIEETTQRGHEVVIATGRALTGTLEESALLGLTSPSQVAITQNGAYIQRVTDRRILHSLTLKGTEVQRLATLDLPEGIQGTFLDHERFFFLNNTPNKYVERDSKLIRMKAVAVDHTAIEADAHYSKFDLIGEPSALDAYEKQMPPWVYEKHQVLRSLPHVLEVLSKQSGKGRALARLADMKQIQPHEIMAIGDAENDITMLEYAGHSVAMGNAPDDIKAICNYETRSNEEDGVAHALKSWVWN